MAFDNSTPMAAFGATQDKFLSDPLTNFSRGRGTGSLFWEIVHFPSSIQESYVGKRYFYW